MIKILNRLCVLVCTTLLAMNCFSDFATHTVSVKSVQTRITLTTTLGHPKSTQCNFNSCSFNCWLDYSNSIGLVAIDICSQFNRLPYQSTIQAIFIFAWNIVLWKLKFPIHEIFHVNDIDLWLAFCQSFHVWCEIIVQDF